MRNVYGILIGLSTLVALCQCGNTHDGGNSNPALSITVSGRASADAPIAGGTVSFYGISKSVVSTGVSLRSGSHALGFPLDTLSRIATGAALSLGKSVTTDGHGLFSATISVPPNVAVLTVVTGGRYVGPGGKLIKVGNRQLKTLDIPRRGKKLVALPNPLRTIAAARAAVILSTPKKKAGSQRGSLGILPAGISLHDGEDAFLLEALDAEDSGEQNTAKITGVPALSIDATPIFPDDSALSATLPKVDEIISNTDAANCVQANTSLDQIGQTVGADGLTVALALSDAAADNGSLTGPLTIIPPVDTDPGDVSGGGSSLDAPATTGLTISGAATNSDGTVSVDPTALLDAVNAAADADAGAAATTVGGTSGTSVDPSTLNLSPPTANPSQVDSPYPLEIDLAANGDPNSPQYNELDISTTDPTLGGTVTTLASTTLTVLDDSACAGNQLVTQTLNTTTDPDTGAPTISLTPTLTLPKAPAPGATYSLLIVSTDTTKGDQPSTCTAFTFPASFPDPNDPSSPASIVIYSAVSDATDSTASSSTGLFIRGRVPRHRRR